MKIGNTAIELVRGDITAQDVDAIVNAANKALAGGGGVDGAIHRAGGSQIMQECRTIGYCAEGEAVITSGGNLAARFVIHTVGPIYNPGAHGQEKVLAAAYRNSLKRAVENDLHSIAFPSISTGAYRYPVRDAAQTALTEVARFIREENHSLEMVRFVLFDDKALRIYEEVLSGIEVK
jgi:O-acetyl-ADP-ribose deacetylase (regulator of RNase III)